MFRNPSSGSFIASSLLAVALQAASQSYPPPRGEQIDGSLAIDRALRASSLTTDGKPFRAVMEIGNAAPYTGRVEVWWLNSDKYRVDIASPKFGARRVVSGGQVQEKMDGDYFPRWLENFVLALIDPLPMARNFRGGSVGIGSDAEGCLRRDDRPGGITDPMTWGIVCFHGSEPRLASVLTFNDSMTFSDWKRFGKKQVARTYETNVLDYKPVTGRLTTLEEIKKVDDTMFAIVTATPIQDRMLTAFVTTLREESLIENAPKIDWPAVREGKTEGYMIVYARTDRTGQVRETAKHNSDQPRLESFGMEQALRYKFKPLIVDGVAQQMEMPLVLHFSSKLADPLPVLGTAEMTRQMVSCKAGRLPSGTPKGTVVHIRVSVDESGVTTGMRPIGPGVGALWLPAMSELRSCRFAPYLVNGKATEYQGDVEFTAR